MGHDFIILATTEFWEHYGYLGLFAGSFLSALFIPLGADLLYVSMLAMGFNPWLCLFVAIPLPGTGAWMGALIAAILDMKLKDSFPVILLGIIIASVLVTGITYGFVSIF